MRNSPNNTGIANAKVTSISLTGNDTVAFWSGTQLLRVFGQVRNIEISRDRQYIVITQLDESIFAFDLWNLSQITSIAYSPINKFAANAQALYSARVNDVYFQIAGRLFKGCCCSTGGDPVTPVSFLYEYNNEFDTAQWYYASGTLFMSSSAVDGQYLGDLLSGLRDGAWVYFMDQEDSANYVVLEVSNYQVFSGVITYTASVVSGSSVGFALETIYVTSFDNVGPSAPAGDFIPYDAADQTTLIQGSFDVDPVGMQFLLTDGSNVSTRDHTNASIEDTVTDGTLTGTSLVTAGTAAITATNAVSGGKSNVLPASVTDSVTSLVSGYVTREVIQDGAMTTYSNNPTFPGDVYAADYSANFTARTKVDKAYVDSAIAAVSGVASVTGDSVDNTDSANPVVNAIPYDAALQTINIGSGGSGLFAVDPTNGLQFRITNAGIITTITLQNGAVGVSVNDGAGKTAVILASPTGISGELQDGTDQAAWSLENNAGVFSSTLKTTSVTGSTEFTAFADKIRVVTPGVSGGGDPTGMVLTGQNADGDLEYDSAGSGGVASVNGDSVDNTDPSNPVINAVPYNAASQSQHIQGDFTVDPGAGVTHTISNAGVDTVLTQQDGAIVAYVADVSTGEGILGIDAGEAKLEVNNFAGGQATSGVNNGATVSAEMTATDGVNAPTILQLSDGVIEISSGAPNFVGATYDANYSADYVDRSLVDKKYVDTAADAAALGILTNTITNGDVTHAPDGNSVFDALALKADATFAAITAILEEAYYSTTNTTETTTSTSLVDIAGLAIPVTAGRTYRVSGKMRLGCNGAGGIQIGIAWTGTGKVDYTNDARTTAASASSKESMSVSVSPLATGLAYNTASNQNGYFDIDFRYTCTVSGTLQLQFRVITGGQTATIYQEGTWIERRRIA